MSRSHQSAPKFGRRVRQRRPGGPTHEHVRAVPMTEAGVPAAAPGAPPPSPAIFTTDESRARYPWLPRRVIVGSVWRGPGHERVKVDANGVARPWPPVRSVG